MKNFILTMFLCSSAAGLTAQEAVTASGNQTQNSSAQICWTIGEPIIETISDSNNELTQGLHQTYLEVTAIGEVQEANYSIAAFPNPATEYVEITVDRDSPKNLSFQLFDSNGRLLLEETIKSNRAIVKTAELSPAVYFITIKENQNTIQTFQILKK
jgi:hypothetical protein